MTKTVGDEKELKKSSDEEYIQYFLSTNPKYKPIINSFDLGDENKALPQATRNRNKVKWIKKNIEDIKWNKKREGMATEGGLPPASESLLPRQNKGGLSKKPKFMKGGSYKGKSHMYAAGGMVKELKI